MILLHHGVDSFDVTFETNISRSVAKLLAETQGVARDRKERQLRDVGRKKFYVEETGGAGGFRYRLDTGLFGATWFIKEPNASDPWGVKVSIKSLPLAVRGLGKCLQDVDECLQALECAALGPQGSSIARLDYAQDFLVPGFEPDATRLVTHSRMGRASDEELQEGGAGHLTHALRIGKMPGKQVAIYDKRRDVIAKHKREWWEIWNANLNAAGLPTITQEGTKGAIWRFEVRAGKKCLKGAGARTFAELREKGLSVLSEVAATIRYAEPTTDQNRARWPDAPIWQAVRANLQSATLFDPLVTPLGTVGVTRGAVGGPLGGANGAIEGSSEGHSRVIFEGCYRGDHGAYCGGVHAPVRMSCAESPSQALSLEDRIKALKLAQQKEYLRKQLIGCSASLAYLEGYEGEKPGRAAEYVSNGILDNIDADPAPFAEKVRKAGERYQWLG